MKYLVLFMMLLLSSVCWGLECSGFNPLLTRALEVVPQNFKLVCEDIEVVNKFDKNFFDTHPFPANISTDVRKIAVREAEHSALFAYLGKVYVRLDTSDYLMLQKIWDNEPSHREEIALIYSTRFYHEAVHVVEYKAGIFFSEESAQRAELQLLDSILAQHKEYGIMAEWTMVTRSVYNKSFHNK